MYPGKMLWWRFATPASGERHAATFRVVLRTCHLLGAPLAIALKPPVTAVTTAVASLLLDATGTSSKAAVVHYKVQSSTLSCK